MFCFEFTRSVRSKGLTPGGIFFYLLPNESCLMNSLLFLVLAKATVFASGIGFYPAIMGIEDTKVSSPWIMLS